MTHASIRVVDSHVHFWDPEQLHYPGLDDDPAMRRAFVPSDVDSGGYLLEAMVFVQAECSREQSLDEVHWVQSLAARFPVVRGIVGHAPLEQGVTPGLEALANEPLVVGVRRLIQDQPPGFTTAPGYVEGVRRAGELGLVVDLCIRWHQMPEVVRLSELCPDVTFALDHAGKPAIVYGAWEPWASGLAALATNPRVHCKLSGLTTEADPATWTPEQIRPYLEHALDVFGPERCLVGSDWPVAIAATTYVRWLDTVVDVLAPLSARHQALVLRNNAITLYGLVMDEQQHALGRL